MDNPRVLIADDSPLVLRMLEKMLSGAGLEVVTAKDGLEAVEKAFSLEFGLVILDVIMPRMNGYQACRLLKTDPTTRHLPVVILTSRDQAGDRFWGLETGADYYVTKDSEPERILELVKNVLSAESGVERQPALKPSTSMDILSRVNELLDRKLYEATILTEIGRVARGLVHFDETFASVMRIVARVCDFTVGAMAFVDEDDLEMVLVVHHPVAPPVVEEAKAKLLEDVGRHRRGIPLAKVQARVLAPGGESRRELEATLGGFASFPIVTNGRLRAILALGGKPLVRLTPETEAFLAQVANQAEIVTENSRLFDRVKNLSIRDGLTDLFNHRHSIELVANEFGRVGRYAGGVSLAMVDIDHFKEINDEQGHPTGDAVLKEVARVLKDAMRTVDSLGRYGGEEFIAILPHTDYKEAVQMAERLRRSIQDHAFRVGGKELRVTVSVGVATYPSKTVDSPNALVREADKALYRAKEAGRNRVAGDLAD